MFSKYNKKSKQLLSALISFSLSFSTFTPVTHVLAADADIIQKQNEALPGLMGAGDQNIANMIANGGQDSVDEMESALQKANQKLIAEKNDAEQQKNSTTSAPKVYTVTRDGSIVTVAENPCYQVTTPTKECPMPNEMWNIATKNSKGVYENRSVLKNTLQYLVSDGKEVDGKMMNMIYTQKTMDMPEMNSDGTVSKVNTQRTVMSAISTVASEIGKSDLSPVQKFMVMMMAYQNAVMSAQQSDADAMAAEEEIKGAEKERQKAWNRIETAQAERDVIRTTTDFPFKVRLNPVLPTINDNKDVEITLLPNDKVKNVSQNQAKYHIEVQFDSQEQLGKTEKLNVKEGRPFIVELGKNPNRSVGSRTIKVILRYDDNKTPPKTYTFSYKVSQYRNVLVSNGKTVSNSVMGVFVNADLAELNGDQLSVAGEITSAKLDENGQCRLRLKDGIGGENGSTPQMDILTTAVSQGECEKQVGKYAAFRKASVKFNESTGRYELIDESDDSTRSIGMNYDGYMQTMDTDADNTQTKVAVGSDIGVVRYGSGDNYDVGLAGAAGVNWTNINGENISVYTDSDGTLKFGKPSGEPYSELELNRKGVRAGIDLNSATITKDENGMLVVKTPSGTQINRNEYTTEAFHNLNRKGESIGNPDNTSAIQEHGEKMAKNGGVSYQNDHPSYAKQLFQHGVNTAKNIVKNNSATKALYELPLFR